jgi:hypothetical protein
MLNQIIKMGQFMIYEKTREKVRPLKLVTETKDTYPLTDMEIKKVIEIITKWLEEIFTDEYGKKFTLPKVRLDHYKVNHVAFTFDLIKIIGIDIEGVLNRFGNSMNLEKSIEVVFLIIISHEYAHIWQRFVHPHEDLSIFKTEEHADYFSGLVVGKYYHKLTEDEKKEAATFYRYCGGGGNYPAIERRIELFNKGVQDGLTDFKKHFKESLTMLSL